MNWIQLIEKKRGTKLGVWNGIGWLWEVWKGCEYDQTTMDTILKELTKISKSLSKLLVWHRRATDSSVSVDVAQLTLPLPLHQNRSSGVQVFMADTYHVHDGWSRKGLLRNYLEEPQKRVVRYPKCPVKNNLKDRVGGWVIRPQKEALHGVLKALKALAFKGEFSVTHNDWGGGEEVRRTHASSLLSWDVLLCPPSCQIQPELEGKDPLLYPAKACLLYCLQCKL